MAPYFTAEFGNPSSIYRLGQEARAAIDQSRHQAARAFGCSPAEIIFTSGATESNNQALLGIVFAALRRSPNVRPHVITSAIEHHAVLHPAEWLMGMGADVTILPSDSQGLVDPDDVRGAVRPETVLISVMYANNETGAIQPLPEIGAIGKERGIPVHTDAVQAAGFLPLHVDDLGVDLLALSAHKFYGPKAVGLLYVRKGVDLPHLQLGGRQECGMRGGTENVPGIVGLGHALEQATLHREEYAADCQKLTASLWGGLEEQVGGMGLNGPPLGGGRRLPNNLNVAIDGVQGETLLLSLDMLGIAASAGSACTTGNTQPSHVLTAMGHSVERARSSLRLTAGRCNTPDDVEEVVDAVATSVARIRSLASR